MGVKITQCTFKPMGVPLDKSTESLHRSSIDLLYYVYVTSTSAFLSDPGRDQPGLFGGVPYWNVAAVDQDLQHRVVLGGVQVGQVVQRGAHRPVHPLSELAGQMFGGAALELPMQNVSEELRGVDIDITLTTIPHNTQYLYL